jgi:exodeoxyribonuclease VII large subunit
MENAQKAASLLDKRLKDLSPLAILGRGYSIARRLPEKTVIRSTADTDAGDRIEVLLGEGELACRVEEAFHKMG